jgi:outer membrane protein OmpA-like peptidoglycan-associated protein
VADNDPRRYTLQVTIAAILATALAARAEADDWITGIGTGAFGLNIEGDMGFGTNLLGPLPVDDLELSSSDLSDVTKSAAGLAGFSTNGRWTIFYGGAGMELEDEDEGTTAGGTPVSASFNFKALKAELAASYTFARTERSTWGFLFGANYTKHDYEAVLAVGANTATRDVENDWTDAIVGLTNAVHFSPKWAWSNRIDAGFGGSEGTYHARTGLEWDAGRPRGWIFSLYADYKKIEFENGSPGDADWYLYDVAEFGPGLGFAYLFGGSAEPVTASLPPPPPAPPPAPPPPPPPAAPADSDFDGVADPADQCANTQRGERVDAAGCAFNLRLEVLFDTNSATLQPDSYAGLDRAVDLLKRVPTISGVIEGHTDSQGPDRYNLDLSDRRARTVADYLFDHGVDRGRIQWKGYGESQPVADNNTADGRAQNRRVVLHRSDAVP